MLRSRNQLKKHFINCRNIARQPRNARKLSTAPSSGGNRSLAIAGGVLLAGGVATLGAASQIPSFRKTLEQNVPPTSFLFNPLLGPLKDNVAAEPLKPQPRKKSKDVFESSLREIRKQEEKIKSEKKVNAEESPSTTLIFSQESPPALVQENESMIREVSPVQEEISLNIPLPPKEEITKDSQELEQTMVGVTSPESIPQLQVEQDSLIKLEGSVQRSPEEVSENLIKLETDVLADEAAISTILDEALASCAGQCSEAIESNREAEKAISLHTTLLREAMDDIEGTAEEKNSRWMDLSRVLEQKSRLQNEAESLSQHARQEISKLEAVISELKKADSPSVVQKIINAEENGNAMRRELEESAKEVNVKLSESHVMSQYKDLIDTAKEQFRQELLSLMPDVKPESGWRRLSQNLSHDDLNALIAHAHRRVDQLQRELAEERALSTNRMEMAVKSARGHWEEQSASEMEKTVEILKRESEIKHDKKLAESRQAFENEMIVQLKRQAAAHSDHLAEMLGIQEKHIESKLGVKFQEKLYEQEQIFASEMDNIKSKYEGELHAITDKFQFDLNKALARVAGIETAVDGRAHIQDESRKAQELWLACEALRVAVQYGDKGRPVPLQRELQAIAQVPGIEPHIVEMVNAFPEKAGDRGVFTEETLRLAYAQVSKTSRRLSLITESRNSFLDYFLSYLKSLLIIRHAKTEPPEDLNPANLDTFSILSYATYCLERGDLEQATRFLNQLTGESKRVSEGWLEEARLLLETKQVVEVLSALASATAIAANLEA